MPIFQFVLEATCISNLFHRETKMLYMYIDMYNDMKKKGEIEKIFSSVRYFETYS